MLSKPVCAARLGVFRNGHNDMERHQRTYMRMPLAVRRNCALSCGEKIILSYLADCIGNNGNCFPSQQTMARENGMSHRQIRRIMDSLIKRKIVEEQIRDGRSSLYSLSEQAKTLVKLSPLHSPQNRTTLDKMTPQGGQDVQGGGTSCPPERIPLNVNKGTHSKKEKEGASPKCEETPIDFAAETAKAITGEPEPEPAPTPRFPVAECPFPAYGEYPDLPPAVKDLIDALAGSSRRFNNMWYSDGEKLVKEWGEETVIKLFHAAKASGKKTWGVIRGYIEATAKVQAKCEASNSAFKAATERKPSTHRTPKRTAWGVS